eukprot:TRINITY_DN5303_c0_g1_i2.p1 TRINITY_DN5303_c0_g1~~TRINITY_DN5303_c0_g1_i2.p1  ORF type:complete len:241 (+),score=31.96 TRINITY_DN5303_c0_g1_i2:50-772(+)
MSKRAIYDLHYSPTPNGWKITIALEEMGLPYNLKLVNLMKGDQRKEAFLKISPNGRMPALVDYEPFGEGSKPLSIFESGAILLHLGEKTGKFLPSDPYERSSVIQWVNWQMGGLGPMAGQLSHFVNYAPRIAPEADHSYSLNRYRGEYTRLISVIENQLKKHKYIACDTYSIADMASYPWVIPAVRFGVSLDDFPNTKRWANELRARPAVHKAIRIAKVGSPAKSASKEEMSKLFQPSKM